VTVSDGDINEMLDSERMARRIKVMFLRNGGVPWAKVAKEVGVSEPTARKDYQIVCRDINNEDPAHVVARHRAVIYDIQRAMYPRLMGANFDQAKDAAVVLLKAQERESRLLGLDSPVKVMAQLSNEDFATEAARLITSIQELDATTLKELSRGQVIDAEVAPPTPVDQQPTESSAEPAGQSGDGDGCGDRQGAQPAQLPDDDDDWSNIGD
jgi:hypothetical protein